MLYFGTFYGSTTHTCCSFHSSMKLYRWLIRWSNNLKYKSKQCFQRSLNWNCSSKLWKFSWTEDEKAPVLVADIIPLISTCFLVTSAFTFHLCCVAFKGTLTNSSLAETRYKSKPRWRNTLRPVYCSPSRPGVFCRETFGGTTIRLIRSPPTVQWWKRPEVPDRCFTLQ